MRDPVIVDGKRRIGKGAWRRAQHSFVKCTVWQLRFAWPTIYLLQLVFQKPQYTLVGNSGGVIKNTIFVSSLKTFADDA